MRREEMPSREHSIEEGLAVRLHDPLWMLGRQWQFGEFMHENAASPAWVDVSTDVHLVDEWRAGDEPRWQPYSAAASPLERLIEEHGGGPTARLRIEGGLRLKRMLAAAGAVDDLAAFRARCPFPASGLVDAGDSLMRDALPDGAQLEGCLASLAGAETRPAELAALSAAGALSSSVAQLSELAEAWLTWWQARAPRTIPEAEDCWDEHRLEHRFALRARTLPGVVLQATEYLGGRLDWSAVDAVAVDAGEPGPPIRIEQRGVPAPARFGGMPAPRLWEMEDARFDPGSIDTAPIDLGRLLLVAYATVYGNDWFVVPLRLPVATLSRVARFDVHDVFGDTTSLTAVGADQDGWNLFGLTAAEQPLVADQERPTSPWFLMAPSLPGSLESQPTDVVVLLRDEMANVAWAVEAVVRDDHDRPRDRFAQWAARHVTPPEDTGWARYRVATEVPDHWFPLVPEQLEDFESVRLRLVPLSRLVNGEAHLAEPIGSLLPRGDAWLHEEEVPRSGVEVVRTWQHARWHDGSRHVWQARRKLTGRGEGSSGLRFDHVDGA